MGKLRLGRRRSLLSSIKLRIPKAGTQTQSSASQPQAHPTPLRASYPAMSVIPPPPPPPSIGSTSPGGITQSGVQMRPVLLEKSGAYPPDAGTPMPGGKHLTSDPSLSISRLPVSLLSGYLFSDGQDRSPVIVSGCRDETSPTGGLHNRHIFPSSGGCASEIQVPADAVLGEGSSWFAEAHPWPGN